MPNVLKDKLGPLPLWGWLAVVTILGLAYYLYEQHKNASASSSTSSSDLTPESDIPQFVIQNTFPTDDTGTASTATKTSTSTGKKKTTGKKSESPTTGYTQVTEREAINDKKLGAKVMSYDNKAKPPKLIDWAGPGTGKGMGLWVSTAWLKQHGSISGTGPDTTTTTGGGGGSGPAASPSSSSSSSAPAAGGGVHRNIASPVRAKPTAKAA